MRPLIRAAAPSDRESLLALFAAQLEEHALPTTGLAAALDGALAEPSRAAVLVAQDGARTVGVAYLAFIWTLEHGGHAAWLDELYVVPELRSRGIGEAILHAAIALARARGCRAMDLEVEADHARAARLYERAGFRPHTRARYVKSLVP